MPCPPVKPAPGRIHAVSSDEALKHGIAISQDVALGQKGGRIRFIVFDIGSIGVGSITIPISSTQDHEPPKNRTSADYARSHVASVCNGRQHSGQAANA